MPDPRASFKKCVQAAIANPTLQIAMDGNAERRKVARMTGYQSLPEGFETVRTQARAIRQETIQHLDFYLAQFTERLQANHIIVHNAADAHAAQGIVIDIVKAHGARMVVKSKTMVGEEIHINDILEQAGITPIETDLGEYIVQLRHEPPAHIITPAVHLRREDVAELFHEKLGMPYTTDVKAMTTLARQILRSAFLKAEVGITGVNLGVAQTGTLVLCSNEGNARMCSTLPSVHIALMGVERLVPSLKDMATILRLLSRSATGQKLTNYVSLIQSPRRLGDEDGAIERHVILLDNGRLNIASSEMKGMLQCIRCGACLNVCPVFREIGGHAYGSVYPGPIGSLVSAGLWGVCEYGHLAKASSLCGACADVCPVGVDFSTLLLRTRKEYISQTSQPLTWRLGMKTFCWLAAHSWAFYLAEKMAAWGTKLLPHHQDWLKWLPSVASGWTISRDFPPFALKPFHERIQSSALLPLQEVKQQEIAITHIPDKPIATDLIAQTALIDRFATEWQNLGGEFHNLTAHDLPEYLLAWLNDHGIHQILAWKENTCNDSVLQATLSLLKRSGFNLLEPFKYSGKSEYKIDAGLTGASCALADSGTLVMPGGEGRLLQASLLAPVHLSILNSSCIFATMADWLVQDGHELVIKSPNTVLISGPSRTADIEMTLTIGMHGPERTIVFCYT